MFINSIMAHTFQGILYFPSQHRSRELRVTFEYRICTTVTAAWAKSCCSLWSLWRRQSLHAVWDFWLQAARTNANSFFLLQFRIRTKHFRENAIFGQACCWRSSFLQGNTWIFGRARLAGLSKAIVWISTAAFRLGHRARERTHAHPLLNSAIAGTTHVSV